MAILPFFTFLVFLVGVKGDSPPVCDMEQCEPQPPIDFKDMRDNILPDEFFLDKYCSPVTKSLTCVKENIEPCKDNFEGEDEEAEAVLSAAIEIVNELCDVNSEIRKEYLSTIPCINDNSAKYQQCARNSSRISRRFLEYVEEKKDRDEDELPTVYKCMNIWLMFGCSLYETTKNCNEDVVEGFLQVGREITPILEDSICPDEVMLKYTKDFVAFIVENPEYIDEFMSVLMEF